MTSVLNKIRKVCDVPYTKNTLQSGIQICKELLKEYPRCLCSVLKNVANMKSSELTYIAFTMCKKNCGFCQTKTNYLYDMVKNMPFHMIQHIIDFDDIKKTNEILFTLLRNHLYEMPEIYIQEIIEAIFEPKKPNQSLYEHIVESNILYTFVDIINKNIGRMKKTKVNMVLTLFYKIIRYMNKVNIRNIQTIIGDIMGVFHSIITEEILDQVDKNIVGDLIVMHFLSFKKSIQSSFKKWYVNEFNKNNEEKEIEESELWKINRKALFESIYMTKLYIRDVLLSYEHPIQYIDKHMYAFITEQLQSEDVDIIMNKVTPNALINLISIMIQEYMNDTFDFKVNPSDMVNASICSGMNLQETIRNFILLKKHPYMIYENENGRMGIDAGGLTRDFYSNYFIQLKTHMVEMDEHMLFSRDLNGVNTLQRLRFAGVLTAYSVLKENISPNIRLHPIITYFIVNGTITEMDHIMDYLVKYNIDYINSLQKIRKLTDEEYTAYLYMQGEDEFIPKGKYILTLLCDRYINPSMVAFMRGYRDIYSQIEMTLYLHSHSLYDYMIGSKSYQILGEENSLESILKIECGDDTTMTEKEKMVVKGTLLEVLENLNQTDINSMQKLMRFWHGSHSILNMGSLNLTLRILYSKDNLYGLFSSSTCFGKLYIHKSHIVPYLNADTRDILKARFISHIERTLENQNLAESAGMYMQLA